MMELFKGSLLPNYRNNHQKLSLSVYSFKHFYNNYFKSFQKMLDISLLCHRKVLRDVISKNDSDLLVAGRAESLLGILIKAHCPFAGMAVFKTVFCIGKESD